MPSANFLTPEQSKALTTRSSSVALKAGAGCGKTHVLTRRFLSHVDPDDEAGRAQLHQLIAITFTDAAAREMRRRIRDECYDQSKAAKSTKGQDDWLRLLREIDTARVSTIHAFCRSVLAAHALEAGLDPTFGVMEQGESDVLQSEVVDDVLREKLAAKDEATLELAASSGLSQLKQQIRSLLAHRHEPEFARWQSGTAEELLAAWQKHYDDTTLVNAVREMASSPAAQSIRLLLAENTLPTSKESFIAARDALLDFLPRLAAGSITGENVQSIRPYVGVSGICTAKEWPTKEAYEQYRDACKVLRDVIDRFPTRPGGDAAREAAHLGLLLLRLTADVAREYERRKGGVKLDYDDLLAKAYALLVDPKHSALRAEFSDQLQLLLVDEFQDTDQLQTDLVRTLCDDRPDAGKLFFVGDINQSIYRFRGAQPEVFQKLMEEVPRTGRLPLSVNFRSQPAILNFVNALFFNNLGDGYLPLQAHRPQTTAEPAVEFLWAHTPNKSSHVKGSAREAREEEARWIAKRLRQLIEQKAPIITAPSGDRGESVQRPLELRDVAILFRALTDVDLYESALREFGLDYYLVGGHAFYAQQEIFDVLNLLRAVDSPADEISLAGALRSPFFSLADESLYWLAESTDSLNDGLFADRLPTQLAAVEHAKATAAASTLSHLRAQKDFVPIATLLADALARTGYDAALLSEFLGERKLANLNKLMEQARAADSGGSLDLSGFIAQLSEFTARQPKEALAATLSESENVIRLMTIHHAKGLEFPLVIVPDLDRPQDFRGPDAAFDAQLGPLIPHRPEDEDSRSTTGMDLYRAREKQADAEERRRLLYVACTRAADYLILSSSVADFDEPDSDWLQLIGNQFELTTGALRVELPTGYAMPHVGVTSKSPVVEFRPVGRSRSADLNAVVASARDDSDAGGGVVPRDVLPVPVDAAARRRFSVSRLSGKIFPYDPVQAALARERTSPTTEAVDPFALGNLVHSVLARIDFTHPEPTATQCEQLAGEIVLKNAPHAAALAREMVDRLIASPRWALLSSAAAVHREIEFLLAWPPGEPHDDGRYLQGFIDCLYQDAAGGWHVVDYKTNDIPSAAVPKVAQQYEMQMMVYALAAEGALGIPPVELVLNFLRPGVEHTFAWDNAARRRGIQLVNDAMLAMQVSTGESIL